MLGFKKKMDKKFKKELQQIFGLGNPKGEVRKCTNCDRWHDILRGTCCVCACGTIVYSKEYSKEKMLEFIEKGGLNSSQP
jgi:hypothetical protein